MIFGFFTQATVHLMNRLTFLPFLTDHLCQPASPAHPIAARAVTRLWPGLTVVRLLAMHSFPLRLTVCRVRYPGAIRKHNEPYWDHCHCQIFRTVPFADTLVRRVGKSAFAATVPARPCPVFGRPIRQWGSPLDYGPVLLLKPFRFHRTMATLPSGCLTTMIQLSFSLGCFRRFRFRARLDPAYWLTPASEALPPPLPTFGYGDPYQSTTGSPTHLIRALPNTHYGVG